MSQPQIYAVEMTESQWDLVVQCLDYVLDRARDPARPQDFQPIDLFARRIVRRRIRECTTEIQSNVPRAGEATE